MADVLLINPPPRGVSAHLSQDVQRKVEYAEPLGLLYLASYLREHAITVDLLDLNVFNGTGQRPCSIDDIVASTLSSSPKIVGLPSFTLLSSDLARISGLLKRESDAIVVHGGPHATFCDESSLLHANADFVVRKEGESTFLHLCRAILEKSDPSGIPGISYLSGTTIVRNPDAERIRNLDSLPFPARDIISQDYYTQSRLNVITGRGCPSPCIYCVSPNYWDQRVTFRSVDNVRAELDDFFSRYDALSETFYINFVDDTFTLGGKARNLEMARMLAGYDHPWHIFSRIDTVPRDVLDEFSRSNCRVIRFGIEAGTQRILDLFGKQQRLDQIRRTIDESKAAGLLTHGSFMICSPTETEEDVQSTIDFASGLSLDYAFFFITTPYPGTVLTDRYVPPYLRDSFGDMDKFLSDTAFFGEYERIPIERKQELLERAYHQFYVVGKRIEEPRGYSLSQRPGHKLHLLQEAVMAHYALTTRSA